LSANKYKKLLQQANLLESRDLEKSLKNLLECVQLLEEDPDLIKNSTNTKEFLKKRILRLETKLSIKYPSISESEEAEESKDLEEIVETKEPEDIEEVVETKEREDVEEVVEPEEPEDIEEVVEPKEPEDVEEVVEPKELKDVEEVVEPKEPEDVEEVVEPKEPEDVDEVLETEEPEDIEEVVESEKPEDVEEVVEPEEPEVIEEKSEIVNIIYTKLKKKKSISYNEYLSFYSYVDKSINEEPKAIIHDEGEIAYFVGDTHGSYEESLIAILYFEKIIEKSPNVKIVFDGDYVDRNLLDLENLTIITAFYLLHQNNVVMLRGNHEDQKINKYYGFYRNLKDYFIIQSRIDEIYGMILNFFMSLPVIHILTLKSNSAELKRIMTVHGGIPIDIKDPSNPVSLDELESKIKIKVPSYEQFDDYMSWLLWSDPKEHIVDYELHPQTGRNYFGESIFQKFMETNKLDLMVRAHEVLEEGYKFFFNKKLISLFSTSYYKNKKIGNAVFMCLKEKNGSINPEFISINDSILN